MNRRTAWVTGASRGVGRGIAVAPGAAALAVDPQLMSLTGQALHIADLADRYGVDVTGLEAGDP